LEIYVAFWQKKKIRLGDALTFS